VDDKKQLSLAERVARLEGALGWIRIEVPLREKMFPISLGVLIVALFFAYIGLGVPNHYYQLLFALLTIALCYHQGWFALPQKSYQWSLGVLNTLVLALLFKLLIGAGTAQPLSWIRLPNITTDKVKEDGGKWLDSITPSLNLSWETTAVSGFIVDLTIIQTFLLIITLIGAVFEFQPFASLTAFLLVVVSIPALMTFDWAWVCPALVAAGIAFYLQSASANVESTAVGVEETK